MAEASLLKPCHLSSNHSLQRRTRTVGPGLGLQIVNRQVVDKLNGTISVESEYGKFTEFKMSFPI